jgi:hypothetical protein
MMARELATNPVVKYTVYPVALRRHPVTFSPGPQSLHLGSVRDLEVIRAP